MTKNVVNISKIKKSYCEKTLNKKLRKENIARINCRRMVRNGLNLTIRRKYNMFFSTFQKVLFYYQDIKLTLKKT